MKRSQVQSTNAQLSLRRCCLISAWFLLGVLWKLMRPLRSVAFLRSLVVGAVFTFVWRASAVNTNVSSDILIGMSTALSGPAADLGKDMRQGLLAGLERANRQGGSGGRQLRLIALDDGYEPARIAPNMRQLIEEN